MAPGGGGKRKRGDRTYSQDNSNDGSRPSPHRPGNLSLAQQTHQYQGHGRDQSEYRGRGGRRASRGGRGGAPLRSPISASNSIPVPFKSGLVTTNPMSPPTSTPHRSEESKQTPPTQQSSVTTHPVPQNSQNPPDPLNEIPPPYDYEFVTENNVRSWNSSGRKVVVDLGIEARRSEDLMALGSILQELIKSGLNARIDPTEAGETIRDVIRETTTPDTNDIGNGIAVPSLGFKAQSFFLDCLSILTDADISNPSLHPLVLSTGVPPILMRQELESSLLQSLGLIRDTFGRMGIRKQTNLLYRQSNYNLLREESEGYSKLVTELFSTSGNEPPTSEVVEDTFERVKAMIGAFDLDVGRVLDVTLDVFAAVLVKQYRFFVKYLRASSWWPDSKEENIGQTPVHAFSTLPKWALPGSSAWTTSEEDKEEFSDLKEQHDRMFWDNVRKLGTNAFFEIGARQMSDSGLKGGRLNDTEQPSAESDEDRKWIEATGSLPPKGNRVAAQLLGFKLRFYASPAREVNDVLPVNLIYLAALLIKIGFISLRDLYPHIWPADDAMEAVREEKMKEKAEREKLNRPGGGALNALMTAGALADDTLPCAGRLRETDGNRGAPARIDPNVEKPIITAPVEEKEGLPEPLDQKVQLLKSLLCIGAIPESLYILGRFPWLPDAFPELPEYIHRILHHCLQKVYEPLRPLSERASLREQKKIPDPDQAGTPKGQVRLAEAPARKVLRWALLDKDDTNEATDYRFYWEDWADTVPVCQTVDDVFSLCATLLNFTGVKIGQDPTLLIKLARIGKASLAEDTSDKNTARWIDLSKRLLVPALSLTRCNPGVVNEVFELLKNFPTRTRYSIYAEWYSGQTSRLPDIKAAFDQARAETKDVLKRISKTNLKSMARALAKVAYASPGIVFTVAIGQIESYDNLVEVVVECARYFTYLGYDVLTWSLMSSLGGKGRDRVQADGMLTSRWLAALSLFAGKVFKRYSVMNPTPILQYVAEQLRKGNSTDLIVLEEITSSMAGIVSDTNFNDLQIQALAGGELLQAQTMLQLLDKRHESRTTAKRLMRSLTEPKLAGQLLISIAQERQTCIYKISEPDAHLKLLGNLFDEIHRVLTQYLDLLRSNLSVKEFDTLVPEVTQLIGEFGVEPNVAFWISRPSITQEMATMDKEIARQREDLKEAQNQASSSMDANGDVEMKAAESEDAERTDNNATQDDGNPTLDLADQDGLMDADVAIKDLPLSLGSSQPAKDTQEIDNDEPWHPVLRTLSDNIKSALPEKTWESLSVPFYVTFWQLSLQDMLVPTQSYDDEINRQKKKVLAVSNDRTDISVAGTQKKEREKQALNDLQDRLRSELKGRVQSFSQTRARLQKEKDRWFAGFWGKWDALNTALIEHCFFPRLILSSTDALYAFKMLKFLHSSGTLNFRTMGVIDLLFREKKMTSLIFLCTAKEAENFGRFLNELLRDMSRWHANKAVYEKEAFGTKKDLPGFAKKMSTDKTPESFFDFEDFRRVLYKWHRVLSSALKTCITSGEYMHIRNAIIILKAIHQYFPAVNWIGRDQLSCVTELSKTETREDLKIAATSLLGNLKRREKQWMLPQAFHLVSLENTRSQPNGADAVKIESANAANGSPGGSARPLTPQPAAVPNRRLDAAAPDYKPLGQPNINGVSKTQTSSGRLEVEDGEIEDAKAADAKLHASTQFTQTAKANQHPQQQQQIATLEPATATSLQAQSDTSQAAPITQATSPAQASGSQDPKILSEVPKGESKPAQAPTTNQNYFPVRPDLDRTSSNSGRMQHVLPSRPEVQLPRPHERHILERPTDRSGRDSRETRFLDHVRPERNGDFVRDRLPDRQLSAPLQRGNERIVDRPPVANREREEGFWGNGREPYSRLGQDDRFGRPPGHDSRSSSRNEWPERGPRDRPSGSEPFHASGLSDMQARSTRDSTMAPPRSNNAQHPDRAALIHGPHSDRAPPFHGEVERTSESLRYDARETRGRTSRPPSPSRHDDRRLPGPPPRYGERRDERPLFEDRRGTEDVSHGHPPRYEDSHPPTGPRGDRPPRSNLADNNASNDRSKELLRPTPPVAPPADPNHGRLNQDSSASSRQQDLNYGRLNPGPDIPSGPRARISAGRGGRNVSAPQSHVNPLQPQHTSQTLPSSPSVPDRLPHTGHFPGRGGHWGSSGLHAPSSTPLSAPPTPAAVAPDTSSMHPDRLAAFHSSNTESPRPQQLQISQSYPPTEHVSSPVSAGPPSGPRGTVHHPPSPAGPSPTNRGPPTGPSFANDRARGDKRFAGLQNVLQQASTPNVPDRNGQGASIRGRGGRPNNINAPSPMDSGPPTPSGLRSETFLGRPDLFGGQRPNGTPPSHIEEERSSSGRRDGAREGERRSARHRGSRPHSEERERREHEDDRPPRRDEHRERRGGSGGGGGGGGGVGLSSRDERSGRRGREDGGKDRDRRTESDRREMEEWENERIRASGGIRDGGDKREERDRRDGGGSGRKRGRGGDDGGGGGERMHGESKRPRRIP